MAILSLIISDVKAEGKAAKTVESACRQSLKDIEVLYVYAGKNSGSHEQVEKLAGEDSRIRVLEAESSDSRIMKNTGLAAAAGKYILFTAPDSEMLDYALEAALNKAEKYELDVLQFAAVPQKKGTCYDVKSVTLSDLRPGDFNRLIGISETGTWAKTNDSPESCLYRRDFLNGKGLAFKDIPHHEKRVFFYQAAAAAGRMMICRDRVMTIPFKVEKRSDNAEYDQGFVKALDEIDAALVQAGCEENVFKELITGQMRKYADLTVNAFCETDEDGQILDNLQVMEKTDAVIRTFSGSYAPELQRQYLMNERKRISKAVPAGKEYAEYTLRHKHCSTPKVSVVVPTMNVEDYLNEALASLSDQKLEDMEFIVLNDGSTDHSMTIINEYAALDERFVVIDKPNSGYGNSMNMGIDRAKGQYLGILEPDDFVPADMFDDLYKIAAANDLDFVKADFYRFKVNPDGSMARKYNRLSGDPSYYGRLVDTSEDIQTFRFIMNTWSGIYKLDFLNRYHIRHNETPGASYQDNGFWFQTFCRGKRVWFVNKPYYMNRRDNPNSSMFSKKKEFCVTEEYKYIYSWMEKEPELLRKYSDIFYAKKYSNFMLTYRRLSEDLKPGYLEHFRDEFKPAMEKGLLDREVMGENAWKHLTDIIADPKAYYERIRVSVIIPVYNAQDYIRQCLDSLLLWNELRFEVICVDDGSKDDSLRILREYEEKDPRVKVITQPNGGAGAARNHGMQYAKGEYLSFLDADDYFEYDMLYKAYEKAFTDDTDITAFRSDQFYEDTGAVEAIEYTINKSLLPDQPVFGADDVPYDIFKLFVGWTWDKLFKTSFVKDLGLKFQEQRTTNDMLFTFSAVVKAERINIINQVLAHHRKSEASLSVTREKSWDCFYHALKALKQQLIDWDLYEKYERDFINYAQHFALWNIESIQGAAYYKLYEKLHDEWVDELGISGHERSYFYNQDEYDRMQRLIGLPAESFLFYQIENRQKNLKSTRERLNKVQKDLNNQKKKVRSLNQENKKLSKSLAKADKEMQAVKESHSWQIGQRITHIPGRIKRMMGRR